MKQKTEFKTIFYSLLALVIIFTIYSWFIKNYEFLFYSVGLVAFVIIIGYYHKFLHLSSHILLGIIALLLLHCAGMFFYIGDTRLYNTVFWLIKYDNITHAVGSFVMALIAYNFLAPHVDKELKNHPYYFGAIILLIAFGIGAVNEILELGAVVFVDAGEMIGDYLNNAKDLVFNAIGAFFAVAIALNYHKKK